MVLQIELTQGRVSAECADPLEPLAVRQEQVLQGGRAGQRLERADGRTGEIEVRQLGPVRRQSGAGELFASGEVAEAETVQLVQRAPALDVAAPRGDEGLQVAEPGQLRHVATGESGDPQVAQASQAGEWTEA